MKSGILLFFLAGWITVLADGAQAQTNLSSLPGAASVLYLDFDGHSDGSGWWSSDSYPNPVVTAASDFSSTKITEVFNRVSEDFRPFNINVTTSEGVYNAAAVANRQRVVITAQSQFYTQENGGAGGVAYRGTFGGGEIACYVFQNFLGNSAKNVAEAASHEAGHTLGLAHHSDYRYNCTKKSEYNPGKGSGQTKWAPIMGNSYSSNISQWYKGAANGSTCTTLIQDDLAVITTNGFGYRADDAGNTLATAIPLSFTGNSLTRKGIIERNSDVDIYKLVIPNSGIYWLTAIPTAFNTSTYSGANLDIRLALFDSTGTTFLFTNDTTRLDASLPSVTLSPGTYYIFLEGVGVSSYVDTGYTGTYDYGSLGEYTLTANRLCTPVITSSTGASRCGPGSLVLNAASSSGVLNWYSSNTSTTVLGTGTSFTTPSLSATTTYFVGATAVGCSTSSARVAVVATVNTQPNASAGPDRTVAQNSGLQSLSGAPSGGTWSGTGVTSAGVFDPNRTPGPYLLRYCVTSNSCTDCDTALVTVTPSATQVATPVISPGTGTYTSTQTVSISCATANATIYYTLTGNTPVIGTTFTRVYTGPVLVSQTTTVKAMGVLNGLSNSAVASAYLTVNNSSIVATPVITPATGSYTGPVQVSISCATSGSVIYYTTNGNIPSTTLNSFTKQYTGPFSISASATIRAIGLKSGLTSSQVAVSFITISNTTPTVATPVITPGTGTYSGSQTVSITSATPAASIYYTVSGNVPVVGTSFTRLYSGPFQVNTSTTVRAMGVASGMLNSGVAVAYLTIAPARMGFEENAVEEAVTDIGSFRLFPNPTQGKITLEPAGTEPFHWELFNAEGRKCRFSSGSDTVGNTELDFADLPKGLYLLRVRTSHGVSSHRIKLE